MSRRIPRDLLALLFVLVVCGCGSSDGPQRLLVSGTVTFRGQPVPRGVISFTPDARRGNRGPQGIASIVDGKFTTDGNGKGSVSGPQIVEIRGSGPAASGGDVRPNSSGERLFPPYTTEIEVGEGDSTFNFEVPDNAGSKRSQ
jgi:hypothetical protein